LSRDITFLSHQSTNYIHYAFHTQFQMPKASGSQNTTPDLRAVIYDQAQAGVKLPEIAKYANVSLRTIQRIIKNREERGHNDDATRSGRPTKVDDRTVRHLKIFLEGNRRESLSNLTSFVNNVAASPVSQDTVRRVLDNQLGMNARVAAKKPFLKPAHRVARREWAKSHRGWEREDWECVIWTDEASVEIGKDSRVVWVWRKPGERYDERCLAPTFKSGRQSLMVWGCMAYGKLGPLVLMPKDERKGADYVRLILSGPLWDFYMERYEEKGLVAVMEDGAPIHRSKVAKDFRTSHHMEVLPHPAQSPDVNPIEHVWKRLKTRINQRPVRPKNLDELWVALQEEWEKIEVEFINSLVESMPNRVEAVLKAKGGSTKY
jgi:transposase